MTGPDARITLADHTRGLPARERKALARKMIRDNLQLDVLPPKGRGDYRRRFCPVCRRGRQFGPHYDRYMRRHYATICKWCQRGIEQRQRLKEKWAHKRRCRKKDRLGRRIRHLHLFHGFERSRATALVVNGEDIRLGYWPPREK